MLKLPKPNFSAFRLEWLCCLILAAAFWTGCGMPDHPEYSTMSHENHALTAKSRSVKVRYGDKDFDVKLHHVDKMLTDIEIASRMGNYKLNCKYTKKQVKLPATLWKKPVVHTFELRTQERDNLSSQGQYSIDTSTLHKLSTAQKTQARDFYQKTVKMTHLLVKEFGKLAFERDRSAFSDITLDIDSSYKNCKLQRHQLARSSAYRTLIRK